jgi:hypothetical protein
VTVSTGIITTIAGTGASSYSGDGGKATSATLYGPFGVDVDSSGTHQYTNSLARIEHFLVDIPYSLLGNVYIADTYNRRIRKVTVSTSMITTIAGTGASSYSGDGGQATSAGLDPAGVSLDSSGTHQYTNSLARIKYSLT